MCALTAAALAAAAVAAAEGGLTLRREPYLGARGEYWEGFLQPAGLLDGALRVRPD